MTIDTQKTIEYRLSTGKRQLMVVICFVFIVLSIILIKVGLSDSYSGRDPLLVAVLCILFFGTLGVKTAIRLVLEPEMHIEVGPAGILDKHISQSVIPWTAIKRFSTWSHYGNSMLMLELTADFEKTMEAPALHRFTVFGNRLVGAKGRCINPSVFNMPYEEFEQVIHAYARAHGSPAAEQLD